ncbi:hypothetical protein [Pelagicoccus sp. SDUM812003]|uniref:hypothetical protein n=1 Tax=Pelagicoccus sp. SDUM812003 TaxID=3041267 RepID=UPI00280ED06C|nr:hypothetical protein [Pelagicoccus sp. SDUM812003]MDQ8203937.1 hypothetical protein [Pelagicoccus sp. SDUM812003]
MITHLTPESRPAVTDGQLVRRFQRASRAVLLFARSQRLQHFRCCQRPGDASTDVDSYLARFAQLEDQLQTLSRKARCENSVIEILKQFSDLRRLPQQFPKSLRQRLAREIEAVLEALR